MSNETTIVAVDDDLFMRHLMADILGDAFRVVTLSSGEACLEWLQSHQADLILLDAKMPGMDGYTTCQELKAGQAEAPPVIFVSSADGLKDRLLGYDAGGDDYLVKPFEPRELLTKVTAMLQAGENRRHLKEQVEYAQCTAMTAMTSMGEMGVLLQSLQRFNGCRELASLGEAVTKGLTEYGLEGVVRVRTPLDSAVVSTRGQPTPLEIAAVDNVAGMGRIVEFRSRMSVSYENLTLLVSNCPVDDDARRGRLRDHLAVLAEGAAGRADAIHRDQIVARAVSAATAALAELDASQRATRSGTSQAVQNMTAALEKAYLSVALTEQQEDHMVGIVRQGVDRIMHSVSTDFDLQQHLTKLVRDLQQALLPVDLGNNG